jgi:hypothetical protein
MQFDPLVADILRMEVDFQGLLGGRRALVERFNRYHPPAVSEWIPASQAPSPDVDDVKAAIDTYHGLYAEQLIALFHEEEPIVLKDSTDALPRMDFRLWHYLWPNTVDDEQREILVRALGGWLGRLVVYFLGGRWVPRKNVEESAVIVGDRAWLPFLRARHALQGPEAPLDYSCSQFRTPTRKKRRARNRRGVSPAIPGPSTSARYRIRTCGLWLRRPTLYPAELIAQTACNEGTSSRLPLLTQARNPTTDDKETPLPRGSSPLPEEPKSSTRQRDGQRAE